ncbi:hypothetical protein LTR04_000637 [Oleoguttula sp. CCFEE 6159]|nr:hypothetical protein LTR04_000637 [Oleoguttula sp. CCFEE 6159]
MVMSHPKTDLTDQPTLFEDLSGISTEDFANPYDALISSCHDDPAEIQARYSIHRTTRNAQLKAKLLASDFPGVSIDPILHKLMHPGIEPGYVDPRHCLVFWARPTQRVKNLVAEVQRRLREAAPNLWLMASENLHLTALEITHSQTAPVIAPLVETMRPKIPEITDFTFDHRARLVKPALGFDASAIALSFVPAAGEMLASSTERTRKDDAYSYHHLRRDLYALCKSTGVEVASRYTVPSAHLTVARFIATADTEAGMQRLVQAFEEINAWLESEYWPEAETETIKDGGEWIVGEEKGLTLRHGTVWYGGGDSARVGKGF